MRIASGGSSETDVAETFDGEASEAAQRYARAIFELAKDAKQLDAVEQDFGTFGAAWRESAELREAARSPLIEPEEKARALTRGCDQARALGPWPQIHRRRRAQPPRRRATRESPPLTARWWRASVAPAKLKSSRPARCGTTKKPPSSNRSANSWGQGRS